MYNYANTIFTCFFFILKPFSHCILLVMRKPTVLSNNIPKLFYPIKSFKYKATFKIHFVILQPKYLLHQLSVLTKQNKKKTMLPLKWSYHFDWRINTINTVWSLYLLYWFLSFFFFYNGLHIFMDIMYGALIWKKLRHGKQYNAMLMFAIN